MLKKTMAMLLALVMMLSIGCTTAFAVSEPTAKSIATATTEADVSVYRDVMLVAGKYVYYPADLESTSKKYPVVTWANGSWCPIQTYLPIIYGLVKAGYIVVADTDLLTNDGESTLDSVKYIVKQNKNKKSKFYNRINTKQIGATGHSFGGQAAVIASAKDSRIKAIVSLAGKSVAREAAKVSVPALYLSGTLDMIVPSGDYVYPSYKASRGPSAYASFKNMTHFGVWISPASYIKYTVAWFDAYLKGDKSKIAMFEEGGDLSKDSAWVDYESKNLRATKPTAPVPVSTSKKLGVGNIGIDIAPDQLTKDVCQYAELDNDYMTGKHVLYPAEMLNNNKKYPVIIWSNGSFCPVQTYYAYLIGLVQRGYVVVADTDLYTTTGKSARDSIDFAINLNKKNDTIFYGRLDTKNIGATGHSLGGKGVVNAAANDKRIKCIVSLAGTQTTADVKKTKAPILYFAGEYDINVPKDKYVIPAYKATTSPAVYVNCLGVEHFAVWYNPGLYTGYAADWFDVYLKGDSKKLSTFKKGGKLSKDKAYTDYMSKNL